MTIAPVENGEDERGRELVMDVDRHSVRGNSLKFNFYNVKPSAIRTFDLPL